MNKNSLPFILSFFLSSHAFGHGGKKHIEKAKEEKIANKNTVCKEINDSYKQNIKPIFSKKCLACHATNKLLPWYYSVPGVKQLMDHDMKEAREHMDMTNDFPFGGHGNPQEDLEELAKTIKNGDMPPIQYKIIHWDSSLTQEEVKTINSWILESKDLMIKKKD